MNTNGGLLGDHGRLGEMELRPTATAAVSSEERAKAEDHLVINRDGAVEVILEGADSGRITGGRLNPNIFKRSFTQNSAVGNTIQRDSAGHTEPLHPRFFVHKARHPKHRFFRNYLDAPRQVHFALRDF